MLHIPHLGINPNLYACIVTLSIDLLVWCTNQRRVGVHDRCCEIQYAAYRHGVLEGGRIERDECGSGVRESGGGSKGELKGLLQEKATKNHEVVSITVLGLHDGGGLEARRVHEDYIVRFAKLVIRIWQG